jgi:hypothetical protein
MYDLFPYRCALICLETVIRRHSDACMMFVFNVLSGRVGLSNFLSLVKESIFLSSEIGVVISSDPSIFAG